MVFRDQERHVVDDPSVMLDGKVFGRVMDRLSTMERIIPIPEELKDISESFIRGQEDKNRARYIVNTAWAHASGRMSKLVDGFFAASTQAVEPKAKQLEGWISELSDFRGQNNIPNHAAQLDVFYHSFPPQAGEYVLGWADMVVWTSHRIVLLTPGAEPAIKATIPLEDVTAYLSSDSTWLKSR
ncbi:MAG: hypothetical protein NTZ17_02040 [Phycisphaerae bacterium]|nr:hypothetical protein [Phycisphaerae bacterium]